MNFQKALPILIIIILALVVLFGIPGSYKTQKENPVPQNDPDSPEVTIGGIRGDFVYVPVEDDCNQQMEEYMKKNDKECELINAYVPDTCEECEEYGFGCSVANCNVCELTCF